MKLNEWINGLWDKIAATTQERLGNVDRPENKIEKMKLSASIVAFISPRVLNISVDIST
jgi:hypothetical protein